MKNRNQRSFGTDPFAMKSVCAINAAHGDSIYVRRCFWLIITLFSHFSDVRRLAVRTRLSWCLRASLAVAGLVLLAGCWLDGPQSTFDVKGPVARAQPVSYTHLRAHETVLDL